MSDEGIDQDALTAALHEYRRCSEEQARGIIGAYLDAIAARRQVRPDARVTVGRSRIGPNGPARTRQVTCTACGGRGYFWGDPRPCVECGGTGKRAPRPVEREAEAMFATPALDPELREGQCLVDPVGAAERAVGSLVPPREGTTEGFGVDRLTGIENAIRELAHGLAAHARSHPATVPEKPA